MTITQDGTSGWYVPASGAEWTTLLAGSGIPNPTSLWLMQEASGTLADSIGSQTLPSEGSRQSYNNTVSGWSRKGLISTGDGWLNTTTAPDPATTSSLTLGIAVTPAADSEIIYGAITSPFAGVSILSGKLHVKSGGNTADSAFDPRSANRVVGLKMDRNLSAAVGYTEQGSVSCSLGSPAGRVTYFVGASITFLYGAQWTGSDAERSDANVATIISRIISGPPASSGYSRGRSVNGGGFGGGSRGRVVNAGGRHVRGPNIAHLASSASLPFRRGNQDACRSPICTP